jgi:hypothetical protein
MAEGDALEKAEDKNGSFKGQPIVDAKLLRKAISLS